MEVGIASIGLDHKHDHSGKFMRPGAPFRSTICDENVDLACCRSGEPACKRVP